RRQRKQVFQMKPVDAGKVQYGHTETKRAIAKVLGKVLNQYCYTSLPELNAVLQQYNIKADRGGKDSRIYRHKGLVYYALDEQGKTVGTPIKASLFYNKPGLKFLEGKYAANRVKRTPHKTGIKNDIDKALLGEKRMPLKKLMKKLEQQGVHTVLRQNKEGLVYGITYVDHRSKCVFNGSALGKKYSAKAIQERCGKRKVFEPDLRWHPAQKQNIGLQSQTK